MSNVESSIKPERYAILGLVYKRLTELGFKNPERVKERFKEHNPELRYVIVIKGRSEEHTSELQSPHQ